MKKFTLILFIISNCVSCTLSAQNFLDTKDAYFGLTPPGLIPEIFDELRKRENNIKPYKVLEGHAHKVQNAFFSPDGQLIISHGWDNTVKIWDT